MLEFEKLGIKTNTPRLAVMLTAGRDGRPYYRPRKMLEGEKVGSVVVLRPRSGFFPGMDWSASVTDAWIHDGKVVVGGWQCQSCHRRFAEKTTICPRCHGHVGLIKLPFKDEERIKFLGEAAPDAAEDVVRQVWAVPEGRGLIGKATEQGVPKLSLVPEWARELADRLDGVKYDLVTQEPEGEADTDRLMLPLLGKVGVLQMEEAEKIFTLLK